MDDNIVYFQKPKTEDEKLLERVAEADNKGMDLARYMTWRAAMEGNVHSMEPAFYGTGMRVGCKVFFGVTVNPETGELLSDDEAPDLFEDYMHMQAEMEAEYKEWLSQQKDEADER
jgi:hypothetical protein